MKLAIALGEKGKGSTFPNPPVGAVIVKNNTIIGKGWHRFRGEDHAETVAIKDAKAHKFDVRGATMFVTLEPCAHFGKTPPCADSIVREGISRVVISTCDNFDKRVCGKGISILRNAGIEVETGVLEKEGRELIEQYIVQRTEKRAFLSVKWAQTLDGFIADKNGSSKWITGEKARKKVHELRAQHGAIAVGAKTAIQDNPELTVRMIKSHCIPARIIIAGKTKLPADLKLFLSEPRTIIVSELDSPFEKKPPKEIETLKIKSGENFWKTLLEKLLEIGVGSVLLEGGGETITSALRDGICDKIYCFIAPKILGEGIPAIRNLEIKNLENIKNLESLKIKRLGDDVLISGIPKK